MDTAGRTRADGVLKEPIDYKDFSEQIITAYHISERQATSIANKCTKSKKENGMKFYTLPLEKSTKITNRFSLGQPYPYGYPPCKTILVMGATGSGKTTWINAMINYVLGVEWDDPFRFVLIEENLRGGSQAHSQTQGVNVYVIHHQEGFRIPFTLLIVDTPEFGDTQGIARDTEITSDISNFFEENGIEELEAVCIAVKCSDARLQKHIFNSVLSIFGADVKENVRFLATFADGTTPSVLDAILAAELPCRLDSKGLPCYKSFNNGTIYVNNQDDEDEMSPIEWKHGMKNFKLFFDELSNMPTTSRQMTREVLENRNQMELKLQWMQTAIKTHLSQKEELRKKEALIELYNAEINENKNYEIKVQVTKKVKENYHLTTLCCQICKTTCQTHCDPNVSIWHIEAFCAVPTAVAAIPIIGWIAMGFQNLLKAIFHPQCTICKCASTKHEKGKFRWVTKMVEETQTLQEMKENYEAAKGKKMNAEQLVEELRKDVDDQKKKIVKEIGEILGEIKDLCNSLKKIALYGNPLSTPEYIRMMIENEKNERQEGHEERIRNLKELFGIVEIGQDDR